ncbi:hypothetical protein TYRP_013627 [Tyrophagus putrescentiae]|nr:hypothetical protein TYRP_013627 [Tyrophagus putrescentiae]
MVLFINKSPPEGRMVRPERKLRTGSAGDEEVE